MKLTLVRALLLGTGLLCAVVTRAQLGQPTTEELQRRNNGPGPVPGGPRANLGTTSNEPASTDPKNFAGTWRMRMGRGPGGPGAPVGPGAGAPPPAPGGPGFAGSGDAGVAGRSGTLSARVVCVPPDGTAAGVDGPLLIVQTPQQITWAAEEMHSIRRIYLTGDFNASFKPNFLGQAIGHWQGNTLVIETRGLNSLPTGGKMIEHWTKSADGTSIEMQIDKVDAHGKPIGATRTQTLSWAPGDRLLEWMCEDYNDEWLPGGKDYHDQLSR